MILDNRNYSWNIQLWTDNVIIIAYFLNLHSIIFHSSFLFNEIWINTICIKALHSELLTELSGRFPSRNEYFVISEVRIWRHFFVIFGKFGISKFPKFQNSEHSEKPVSEITELFPKLPNFFRTFYQTFPKFLTEKQGFLP